MKSWFSSLFGSCSVELPEPQPMYRSETRYGPVPHTCPLCKGDGRGLNDRRCRACKGKGIVWQPATKELP